MHHFRTRCRPASSVSTDSNLIVAALLVVLGCTSFAGIPLRAQDSAAETTEPMPERGDTSEALAGFDQLMRSFVTEHKIPGAALAVTRKGQLVYARGFGYADRDAREPVLPDTRFRIASIAKPITAAAVLRLVDQGRLSLDDLVIKRLPHLEVSGSPVTPADSRWNQVTVRQALQHRGGWDRGVSGDPMFRSAKIAKELAIAVPPGPTDIVRYMLSQPLDFDPDQRYAYSNFGYCVLGRILEEATGRSYEAAIQETLLAPLGITRMCIGRTFRTQRYAGEACYYEPGDPTEPALYGPQIGQPVPVPYGTWYHESLDAHGGWIGSAVDLVRFATVIQPAAPNGLLSPAMLSELRARPPEPANSGPGSAAFQSVYYGLGWSIRELEAGGRLNLWHNGLLPGTSTLLVVRHDGLCWCVLFNTSHTDDGRIPSSVIDPLLHQAADEVRSWPDGDRFPDFLAAPATGR
jgi:N-acyl-D-amino-acid deacylase